MPSAGLNSYVHESLARQVLQIISLAKRDINTCYNAREHTVDLVQVYITGICSLNQELKYLNSEPTYHADDILQLF